MLGVVCGALSAFVAGLALWAGTSFRGVDAVLAVLFAGGAALGTFSYLRGPEVEIRRLGVIAAGFNLASLLLHMMATR
jgi:hypothetical protein